jgi:hypothetical protein
MTEHLITLLYAATNKQIKIHAVPASQKDEENLLKLLEEQNPEETRKKVEAFFVCPLCGTHKKLNKATGVGSNTRIINKKRNIALKEKFGLEEDVFKTRDRQEYLLKYIKNNEVKEAIKQIAQEAAKLLHPSEKKQVEPALEDAVKEFLIQKQQNNEIIKQPIINEKTNIKDQKIISLRLNFGNRKFGKQQKYFILMSELRKGAIAIVEEIMRGSIRPKPEGKEEGEESELLKELEKILKKEEVQEEEFYGLTEKDEEEILKTIERITDKKGYIIIDKLFPKLRELTNKELSGFVEVESLSIEEIKEIIRLVKGTKTETLKRLLEIIQNKHSKQEEITRKDVLSFIVFIGYLVWQLKIIRKTCLQIAETLKDI